MKVSKKGGATKGGKFFACYGLKVSKKGKVTTGGKVLACYKLKVSKIGWATKERTFSLATD